MKPQARKTILKDIWKKREVSSLSKMDKQELHKGSLSQILRTAEDTRLTAPPSWAHRTVNTHSKIRETRLENLQAICSAPIKQIRHSWPGRSLSTFKAGAGLWDLLTTADPRCSSRKVGYTPFIVFRANCVKCFGRIKGSNISSENELMISGGGEGVPNLRSAGS